MFPSFFLPKVIEESITIEIFTSILYGRNSPNDIGTYHLSITKHRPKRPKRSIKPKRWYLQVVSFRDSRDCVTHIAFSSDSNHLALAHADRSLCLYRWKVGVKKMGVFLDPVELIFFCCCHCNCVEVGVVVIVVVFPHQHRSRVGGPLIVRKRIDRPFLAVPFKSILLTSTNPKNSAKHRHLGSFQHSLSSPFTRQKTLCEPRKKTLVGWVIWGTILPSYIGIIINHYKDPH